MSLKPIKMIEINNGLTAPNAHLTTNKTKQKTKYMTRDNVTQFKNRIASN